MQDNDTNGADNMAEAFLFFGKFFYFLVAKFCILLNLLKSY